MAEQERDVTVQASLTLHLNGFDTNQEAEDQAATMVENALAELLRRLEGAGIPGVLLEVKIEQTDTHAPLSR